MKYFILLMFFTSSAVFSKDWVCEQDNRAVDGVLRSLRLQETDDGLFDLTYSAHYFDRVKGEPVEESLVLGSGLDCYFSEEDERLLSCSKAERIRVEGIRQINTYRIETIQRVQTSADPVRKQDIRREDLRVVLSSPHIQAGEPPLMSEKDGSTELLFSPKGRGFKCSFL